VYNNVAMNSKFTAALLHRLLFDYILFGRMRCKQFEHLYLDEIINSCDHLFCNYPIRNDNRVKWNGVTELD